MKKNGILNSHISKVLSDMGHKDKLVIADCGLPIPIGVEKIDLALRIGSPGFIETLKEVLADFVIEQAVVANEIKDHNETNHQEILCLLQSGAIEYVSHETFKQYTADAKAIIRTGEVTPFSNIVLQAGVIF